MKAAKKCAEDLLAFAEVQSLDNQATEATIQALQKELVTAGATVLEERKLLKMVRDLHESELRRLRDANLEEISKVVHP